MVVTFLPETAETGVMQERLASPLMCTVQAPHRAIPQPNFVPVMFRVSRRTHSRGIWGSTSTDCDFPLRVKVIGMRTSAGAGAAADILTQAAFYEKSYSPYADRTQISPGREQFPGIAGGPRAARARRRA